VFHTSYPSSTATIVRRETPPTLRRAATVTRPRHTSLPARVSIFNLRFEGNHNEAMVFLSIPTLPGSSRMSCPEPFGPVHSCLQLADVGHSHGLSGVLAIGSLTGEEPLAVNDSGFVDSRFTDLYRQFPAEVASPQTSPSAATRFLPSNPIVVYSVVALAETGAALRNKHRVVGHKQMYRAQSGYGIATTSPPTSRHIVCGKGARPINWNRPGF
jgi:hypothetical protein